MDGVRRAVAIVGVRHGFVVVADADVVFCDCHCCDCNYTRSAAGVLLSAWHDCHCHCQIAFRMKLPLLVCVLRSRSSCSCCCCCGVSFALGGKDAMVTKMLIENVLMPLLMVKDC